KIEGSTFKTTVSDTAGNRIYSFLNDSNLILRKERSDTVILAETTLRAGEIASNNNFKFTGTDIQLDSMKRIHASGYWFLESGGYLDVRSNNGLRVKD